MHAGASLARRIRLLMTGGWQSAARGGSGDAPTCSAPSCFCHPRPAKSVRAASLARKIRHPAWPVPLLRLYWMKLSLVSRMPAVVPVAAVFVRRESWRRANAPGRSPPASSTEGHDELDRLRRWDAFKRLRAPAQEATAVAVWAAR